jgi:hypothetical protein
VGQVDSNTAFPALFFKIVCVASFCTQPLKAALDNEIARPTIARPPGDTKMNNSRPEHLSLDAARRMYAWRCPKIVRVETLCKQPLETPFDNKIAKATLPPPRDAMNIPRPEHLSLETAPRLYAEAS